MTSSTSISTVFHGLTSFELWAWLDEGEPTDKEVIAINRELAIRAERRAAIENFLW